jgi:hypothetical protein
MSQAFVHPGWRFKKMSYNWDLIERLLHEVQNSAGTSFAPRKYAEDYAEAKANGGESPGNVDHLKATAAEYEQVLLERGFIASRP